MERLWDNTRYFKAELARLGFDTMGSADAHHAGCVRRAGGGLRGQPPLLEEGVFAVGLGFPTVPRGLARIRNIVTAEHTRDDLDFALAAYEQVGRRLKVAGV